jgi:hypothetical protein
MAGSQFEMEVTSAARGDQGERVQVVADAITECSNFTTSADGRTAKVSMAPLSFPNLGDQTLAVRMNLKVDGLEAVSDLVVVAVGHNVVSFSLDPPIGWDVARRRC